MALLVGCLTAQPALLADQTLCEPDPACMHSGSLMSIDKGNKVMNDDAIRCTACRHNQAACRQDACPL